MADVTVKVIVEATSFDFLTLDECKTYLGINKLDTSQDETLQMMISVNSAIIAELCNRTFARETVVETWREVFDGRVFLTHWPVKEEDITAVVPAGYPYTTDQYELEEASGKVSNVHVSGVLGFYDPESAHWDQSVIVAYTGGFVLPDEAPLPLKHATAMMVREDRIRNVTSQVAGIRQISHKEARVSFFDPNALLVKTAGMPSQAQSAVGALLSHYTRHWV